MPEPSHPRLQGRYVRHRLQGWESSRNLQSSERGREEKCVHSTLRSRAGATVLLFAAITTAITRITPPVSHPSLHGPRASVTPHSIWRNEVQKDQETRPHSRQAAEAGPQPGFPRLPNPTGPWGGEGRWGGREEASWDQPWSHDANREQAVKGRWKQGGTQREGKMERGPGLGAGRGQTV